MLKGINKKIFEEFKSNKYDYFPNGSTESIEELLELPYDKYEKRQDIALDIIEKILSCHGKIGISPYIKQLVKIEPVMMQLQERLRDHIVHSIYTFLIGIYVKSKLSSTPNDNIEYKGEFAFRWKLCSSLHDIGYPIEIFDNLINTWNSKVIGIKNNISKKQDENDIENISNNFFKVIEQYRKLENDKEALDYIKKRLEKWDIDLDPFNYLNWLKSKRKSDHGVVSAIVLLNLLDCIYQKHNPNRKPERITDAGKNYDQRIFENDLVSVCTSIFIHNVDQGYLDKNPIKIDYNNAPLAFLLSLCDKIQEWDRPGSELSEKEVYGPEKFQIEVENNKLTMSMDIEEDRKKDIKNEINQTLTGLDIEII